LYLTIKCCLSSFIKVMKLERWAVLQNTSKRRHPLTWKIVLFMG